MHVAEFVLRLLPLFEANVTKIDIDVNSRVDRIATPMEIENVYKCKRMYINVNKCT